MFSNKYYRATFRAMLRKSCATDFACLLMYACCLYSLSAAGQTEQTNGHREAQQLVGTLPCRIAYNEKLPLPFLQDSLMYSCSWRIEDAHKKVLAKGSGPELSEYVFEHPGVFHLYFTLDPSVFLQAQSNGICFHPSIPASVELQVSPQKVVFDLTSVSFKRPLSGGVEQMGNVLYIPVWVATYDKRPIQFKNARMRTAGIQANVSGKLMEKNATLYPGNQLLAYELQGSVLQNSYIMLDFEDPEGNIQSIAWTEKIK